MENNTAVRRKYGRLNKVFNIQHKKDSSPRRVSFSPSSCRGGENPPHKISNTTDLSNFPRSHFLAPQPISRAQHRKACYGPNTRAAEES